MARSSGDRPGRQLQGPLDQLAAEDVPELIREARLEARARAKEILTEALTEAMLERALPATPATATPAPEPDAAGEGLYVLCVIAASAELPPALPGIAQAPPQRITHGDLAAVVCPVPLAEFGEDQLRAHLQDMAWLERVARAHEEGLEQIADETTAIPMRLCTVYRAESGVREMLLREQESLTQALAHLQDRREWGVKVFATAGGAVQADSPGSPAENGAEYLRRLQQERDQRQHLSEELHEACAQIHERLGLIAEDALRNPPHRPEVSGHEGEMLLNGVYLVDDSRLDEFLQAVSELRDQHQALGLELESTGPWPAYNFVPGAIGAAW